MSKIEIKTPNERFVGKLHNEKAPESVSVMQDILPIESELMHVRWSGHAIWIDIDGISLPEIPRENHTAYPSRGDVLLYPGYKNDQEILISCGPTCFKSPAGEIAGNHVATLEATPQELAEIEERTLHDGVLDVLIE